MVEEDAELFEGFLFGTSPCVGSAVGVTTEAVGEILGWWMMCTIRGLDGVGSCNKGMFEFELIVS